ncbi:hypothetical protein SKAU_G00161170 [Synaphobranchus kaupii]|uniref:C2H2-type domain-containing protein n=1 Tax=Synaphobranchus kaupii TaxID=118154 RepID=A0A9Q1FJ11_SYNKA|nr:hypothetical protein SKAU_G00161170 [Synaphobranchus kaupii]
MFHGGGPPGGRYPRQYAPRCRIPTPFEQSQGPRMATGFGPQFGPVSYNMPSRPTVPCGSFVPHQYERNQHAFPQFYHSSSEECRRYSTGKSEPSPGPGNNQGPCGGTPGENISRQLNPSLPFAGFSIDQTQVSVGNSPLGLPAHTKSSQFNPLSQEHIENERAGEEFLRCLAAKEKYPVRDGVVNRQDPLYRHPCPGNGQGQEPKDDQKTALDMFRELLLAGQLNEREELLNLAALKKELDIAGHGRPSTQTSHPSVNILGEHQSRSSLPRETQSPLSAVTKGKEPGLFASIPGQMRQQSHGQTVQAVRQDLNMVQYGETSGHAKQETEEESVGEFLLPHERVRHDSSGFSRILGVMGNQPDMQERKKLFTDIEDEEEFLYGDEVDIGKVSVRTEAEERQAVDVAGERHSVDVAEERQAVDVAEERQAVVDFEKIKKALTTIGLDLGTSEISKLIARMQEHQTCQITESPHLKGASSSGGLSPSQSHSLKRNRSPNPEIYSNSHSSAKQALYIGASAGFVKTEFDTSTQEKQAREIPFFRPVNVQQPLVTTKMQTSLGSETAIWGHSQLKVENYCLQKPNLPVYHAPAVDHQILGLGLGPLKEILETVKATAKAPGMDTLIDLANQSARMRTSQRKKNSEENAKVNEEALRTDVQEQMKRKDHLLKELESLLKREVSPFVVPVIGFCCQLCEEFFGDITSAQDHAACPSHKEKCKKHGSWNKKLGGNLEVRPTVDTGKRDLRESVHKWTSRDDSKGYRGIGEQVSVKEEKLEAARQVEKELRKTPCSHSNWRMLGKESG